MDKKQKILISGCAGFIGMHLSERLLKNNFQILGIDNLNDYYDVDLKKDRLKNLTFYENFLFEKIDISNYDKLSKIIKTFKPKIVINLAAQAGVRYSITNPQSYISSNIQGFLNILECCRYNNISRLIYASSSSVYGANKKKPFSIEDKVDRPLSIYAATKKANELMAHSYNHLYKINTIGLRFFTVYGPWGRPDMAIFLFTKNIINGESINVFNHGKMQRDFTYIDDIVDGVESCIKTNKFKYEIFNLGNNNCVSIRDMIKSLETALNKKAKINYMDMQLGDVETTFADIDYSKDKLGYEPKNTINRGIPKFVNWYRKYYKI